MTQCLFSFHTLKRSQIRDHRFEIFNEYWATIAQKSSIFITKKMSQSDIVGAVRDAALLTNQMRLRMKLEWLFSRLSYLLYSWFKLIDRVRNFVRRRKDLIFQTLLITFVINIMSLSTRIRKFSIAQARNRSNYRCSLMNLSKERRCSRIFTRKRNMRRHERE